MGIILDFDKPTGTQNQQNPLRRRVKQPLARDLTESLSINGDLTRGLYHNSYPGLKLAGALAYAPIFVPVAFMGLPVPKADDETAQEVLDEFLKNFTKEITQIQTIGLREGTAHVWPYYDADTRKICVEFLKDESVTILRDATNNKVVAYIVDEEITTQHTDTYTVTVRKRRTFTALAIKTEYIGGQVAGLQNTIQRNVLGRLPHTFANEAEGDEVRGRSQYERILPDLKNYNDVEQAWSIMLAEFSPKLVQTVSNVRQWLVNNGYADSTDTEPGDALGNVDIAGADFFVNQVDQGWTEKTEIIFPTAAHDAYDKKQQHNFWKIVQGTLLPEMVWGLVSTGNHASAEQQMQTLHMFVDAHRTQWTDEFNAFFESLLLLANMSRLLRLRNLHVKETVWGNLSALSAETRAKVFVQFAQALSFLMGSVTFTKEQLHEMWLQQFPEQTEGDFEKFAKQLDAMAKFKKYKDSQYDSDIDLPSPTEVDENGESVTIVEDVSPEETDPVATDE
jgi:hypothetical protein